MRVFWVQGEIPVQFGVTRSLRAQGRYQSPSLFYYSQVIEHNSAWYKLGSKLTALIPFMFKYIDCSSTKQKFNIVKDFIFRDQHHLNNNNQFLSLLFIQVNYFLALQLTTRAFFYLALEQEIIAAGLTLEVITISKEIRTINILGRTGTATASWMTYRSTIVIENGGEICIWKNPKETQEEEILHKDKHVFSLTHLFICDWTPGHQDLRALTKWLGSCVSSWLPTTLKTLGYDFKMSRYKPTS